MPPSASGQVAGLGGVHLKLRRAEEHLDQFDREVKAWHDRHAVQFVTDEHAESLQEARKHIGLPPRELPNVPCVHRTYRVKFNEPIPAGWCVLLGDAIHNLRSSLDHLVWQLASPPLGTGASSKNEFPIYETAAHFKAHGAEKLKGVSAEARALVEGINPYRDGGSIGEHLFVLNRLSRFDKHRVLNLVAAIPDAHDVVPTRGSPPIAAFFHNVGVPLEEDVVVAEVLLAPDSDVELRTHVFIHFEPRGPGEGGNVGLLKWVLKEMREDILPKFQHLFL